MLSIENTTCTVKSFIPNTTAFNSLACLLSIVQSAAVWMSYTRPYCRNHRHHHRIRLRTYTISPLASVGSGLHPQWTCGVNQVSRLLLVNLLRYTCRIAVSIRELFVPDHQFSETCLLVTRYFQRANSWNSRSSNWFPINNEIILTK